MVDLARLSGERLQDLKDDKRKAQLASARQVLEKSTMMLLTSSKVSILAFLAETCKGHAVHSLKKTGAM